MLKILIASNKIPNSLIIYEGDPAGFVEDLPQKLRDRAIDALDNLCKNGIYALEYDKEQGLVLLQNGRYYSCDLAPDFLPKEFLKPLVETIQSLHWYIGPHIYPPVPGRVDGGLLCRDCGAVQMLYNNNKCQSSICPSHEKWKQVMDGYEPQKNLVQRAFAGIPRTGDANSWAQKV